MTTETRTETLGERVNEYATQVQAIRTLEQELKLEKGACLRSQTPPQTALCGFPLSRE